MATADLIETPGPAALIPSWVHDLESFRRWTHSADFPEQGLVAYFEGDIWVDLSMEELLTHNFVRTAYTITLGSIAKQANLGAFVSDRMRWTHVEADLSTEPDGLFYAWATLQSGKLRFVKGARGGIIELEGTPDQALEIVSATSVNKDTTRLRDLYWRAGVTEYWLVDVRGNSLKFDILSHTPTGYVTVVPADGWCHSTVFGRAFKLLRDTDPTGNPSYQLAVR